MRNRSDTWARIASKGDFRMETVAVINGVEYSKITAPIIKNGLLPDKTLSVGNCIAGTLSFSVMTNDEIPKSAQVVIKARITNGTEYSEWLEFGTFWINQRSVNDDLEEKLITLECYDAMLKGNQQYNDTSASTNWPKPMQTVVNRIAEQMGVQIDSRTVIKTGTEYIVYKPDDDSTLLDTLSYIACMHGSNWTITPENKLRLVPIVSVPTETYYVIDEQGKRIRTPESDYIVSQHGQTVILPNGIASIDIPVVLGEITTATPYRISRVTMTIDKDTYYTAGDDTGYELSMTVPHATQALCDALLSDMYGVAYAPYTMTKAVFDPAAELGDMLIAGDKVHSIQYTSTQKLDLTYQVDAAAPGEDETEDEYAFVTETQKTRYALQDLKKDNTVIRSEIQQTQNSISLEVVRATEAEGGLTNRIADAEESISDEEERATNAEASITSRLAVAEGSISAEVTRASEAEGNLSSRIDINAGNIELKVGKDNVIASINASTETSGGSAVTISAEKVNLIGYATFTSLQTAGQSIINGSNVTAGINGQNINTGSISDTQLTDETKSKIVSGSSTKVQYYLSNSSASATGGTWQDAVPTWSSGKYVWTRVVTTTTPISGAATTTYKPSENGSYDSNLTSALSTANNALNVANSRITTFYQANTPTANATGDLWVDTDDGNKLYRWNGTTWVSVQDSGIQTAITNAATAQSTADSKIVTFAQTSQPTASDVGDLWIDTDDGNKLYRWNGTAWVSVQDEAIAAAAAIATLAQQTANSKTTTFFQKNAPTANAIGDLWMDTDDGNKLYRWNGSTWANAQDTAIQTALSNAATAQSTADGKIVTFAQTSQPAATDVGDLWIDTDDGNKMYRWNGTTWVDVQDDAIDDAAALAVAAQQTANSRITTFYQDNAPTANTSGDLWIDTNDSNKLYRWNGTSWVSVRDSGIQTAISNAATAQATADGKIVTFAQTTQPTATDVGDLWIDTDDKNKMYRWSGSAWVSVRDSTIADAAALASAAQQAANSKTTTFYQNDAPTANAAGDLWIDTNDGNKMYRWNGSQWVSIQDGAIQTALTNAATAQSTADGKIVTFAQTSQPTATDVGDLWIDTDDKNKLYRWSGSAWVSAQDGTIADAAALANSKTTTFYQTSAPTAIAVGDLWIDTDDGNKLHRWNGNAWINVQDAAIQTAIANAATAQSTADGKIVTFAQPAQPTATDIGDLWIDIDDGNKLYRWSGTAWVDIQDDAIADAAALAVLAQQTANNKTTTFYQTSAPTASAVGDLWIDTDDGNKLYRWNGSSWVNVQDSAIQTALTNAATAQNTADGKIVTFAQTSQPTATDVGDLWIDTDDGNKLYRWSGTAWVDIQDDAIADAAALATTAQNTANSAVGSVTVKEQYYLSTSSDVRWGGTWQDSIPTWSSGKYVWKRIVTTTSPVSGNSTTTYKPSENGAYDENLTTALSTANNALSNAAIAQSTADSAARLMQTIYISKPSSTTSVSGNTTWVTDRTGDQNTWTTVRPEYNKDYPVLFTAVQRQTVAENIAGSACTCTTPAMDKTTTVIDGGNIITGSITAAAIAANTITADKINATNLQVSAANITGTLTASQVNLTDYATFSSLSTAGQTTINGANITTGIIQDSGANTTFNLATGELSIGNGSINLGDGSFQVLSNGRLTATNATIAGAIESTGTGSAGDHKIALKNGELLLYDDSNLTRVVGKITNSNGVTMRSANNNHYININGSGSNSGITICSSRISIQQSPSDLPKDGYSGNIMGSTYYKGFCVGSYSLNGYTGAVSTSGGIIVFHDGICTGLT